ncbi:metalloendopeptidase-like membrane protein [Desulfosporosinus orientis DSM 765]|uniref:Metalloendopeptidase-like membrane protein n=1 Tax=Desulfosporosinus orientis (strain ATCC 19365 / DSM 765 / NCIMB 8382 / VKM B-1628 / Singapore I) TaxID=768706 RepID=G7WBZ9_DESOD|nr:M23 family metallopeptidase [Desulfosporosinus orientis]AET69973.1 metalloendopeptidase-like membrane protein [Desulfosporosinus orientis DSM 765]
MKDKYTIIFIPPDHSSTRQFQISRLGKKYLYLGLFVVSMIFIGLLAGNLYLNYYLRELQPTIDHITQLQSTIEERDREITDLNQKSTQINEDLTKITELEDKLSSILQIHPTSLSRGISSDTPNYILTKPAVLTPDQKIKSLGEHLSLLEGYYEAAVQQKERLDHTPNILPAEGEITSSFGYRKNPFGGWSNEFHNGIDIACYYGTPVLATADGVVTFAGRNPIYGLRIDIDHGNGVTTFYGHNSRLLVKEGDQVKRYDLIAYSGNSGRSTGAHLHYGTIVNGKNVDPLSFTIITKETQGNV